MFEPKCLVDAGMCVCGAIWCNSCLHHAYTRRFSQPAAFLSTGARPAIIAKVNKHILMS